MDVTLALQRAVKAFPHGSDALAARLRISTTSLLHKVSPTYPGAHCSPEEALAIMEATNDHGALHAMAGQLGYVLLPMPGGEEAGGQIATHLATTVREFGEFVAEAARDLGEGKCTTNELARVEREGAEALAAIQQLLSLAQQLHAAGRPGGEG